MLDKNDYELMDFLMAGMVFEKKQFAASKFTSEAFAYLVDKYEDDFIPVGSQLLKKHAMQLMAQENIDVN